MQLVVVEFNLEIILTLYNLLVNIYQVVYNILINTTSCMMKSNQLNSSEFLTPIVDKNENT